MQVGFIGIGRMGSGMAANLIAAGHALTVYNRSPAKAKRLLAKGARLAKTSADAARGDVVITMLADDRAAEAVVFGPDGILETLPPGGVHLSMSTISVALAERLAKAHREKGQDLVSGPVFGRPDAAAAVHLGGGSSGGYRKMPTALRCARPAQLPRVGRGAEGQSRQAQRQFPDRLGPSRLWVSAKPG